MSLNSKVRESLVKILAAGLSLLVTYAFIEAGYRYSVGRKLSAGKYAVTTMSSRLYDPASPGYFAVDTKLRYRMFTADHELAKQNMVVTNNFGFISGNDYTVEKPAGEFRIVVLGDSLTACETNDFPWADVLEKHLNQDAKLKSALNAKTVRVFNLGLSGSGFPTMLFNFVRHGEQFQPDLVVVNYIEDDFHREAGADAAEQVRTAELVRATPPTPCKHYPSVRVGDAEVFVHAPRLDVAPSLTDPDVTPSHLFIMPDEVALDKARVDAVKAEIASTILWSRLWLSPRPLAIQRALGRKFSLDYDRYVYSRLFSNPAEAIAQAGSMMSALEAQHPKVLMLQNPLQPELVAKRPLPFTPGLRKQRPDLTIIEMAQYMPSDKGSEEIGSWYNLPHDGHWSNRGAEVYAAAIHRAFSERLPRFMSSATSENKVEQTAAGSRTTR